jgi:hypothetical protein
MPSGVFVLVAQSIQRSAPPHAAALSEVEHFEGYTEDPDPLGFYPRTFHLKRLALWRFHLTPDQIAMTSHL